MSICWPASATNQSSLVTLSFDLESGVRVTCDVGYLCANFGRPRPLCSRHIFTYYLRPSYSGIVSKWLHRTYHQTCIWYIRDIILVFSAESALPNAEAVTRNWSVKFGESTKNLRDSTSISAHVVNGITKVH